MNTQDSTTPKKIIAAFDFDGTIIKHDSLLVFIWFAVGIRQLTIGIIKALPHLIKYQLKLIPNYTAKEKLFTALFKGMPIADFNKTSLEFLPKIKQMVNADALNKIKWHQENGHEVIIISASAENWILPWAKTIGVTNVLATQLEVVDGLITGKFLSKNCHGPEKVNRLYTIHPDRKTYELYAYGDSNGDKELLSIADHQFYRKFN
jgi:phosphatidylglycerophosphatase C